MNSVVDTPIERTKGLNFSIGVPKGRNFIDEIITPCVGKLNTQTIIFVETTNIEVMLRGCLLYTSDAADE